MRKNVFALSAALVLSSMVVWGCSSSPTKDELRQLETTQAEITSLAQKASALKMEKASLQQTIKDKQSKLTTCQDEKTAVESKLKGSN
jgi:septal ring factor EnvC (AmiA/AmiB activator)